jgi:hypothetical protein
MHIMVKISIIFAIFLAVSCTQNLPEVPTFKVQYCKLNGKCIKITDNDKTDCSDNGGKVIIDDFCPSEKSSSSVVLSSSSLD